MSNESDLTGRQPKNSMNRTVGRRRSWKWKKTETIISIVVALMGLIAALIPLLATRMPKPTSTPTPISTCFGLDDIMVRFHILNNQKEIAVLAPAASVHLEPGLTVYLQAEISSVSGKTLPDFACTWKNAGTFSGQGMLLHKNSCRVDYQSGNPDVTDTLSLQLSQQPCPALAPYVFFILPTP